MYKVLSIAISSASTLKSTIIASLGYSIPPLGFPLLITWGASILAPDIWWHPWEMFFFLERYSLVGGLEHEFYDFPYVGNVIIPTVTHSDFFEGVGIPPTSN